MRTIEQYDQLIDIQQRDLHLVKKTKNKKQRDLHRKYNSVYIHDKKINKSVYIAQAWNTIWQDYGLD
jgi:hypothetical protein